MTRMTTDVDAFSQLLQTGLITALVNILSFVGVLVVLSLLSWPLTLGVLVLVPPLLGRHRVVRPPLGARVRARPGDDLHGQRRVPGEPLGGARGRRRTCGRSGNIESLPRHRAPLPRRAACGRRCSRRSTSRSSCSSPRAATRWCSGSARARARRHHRRRHRHRVPALPRPVLRTDPAAVPGVRPVAAGGGVDDEDQRAHADTGDDARRGRTRRPRRTCAAPCASTTCTSPTRAPDGETLHGIDLEVAAGETVALVGETGAGKSTLVKLVARFYDADSGPGARRRCSRHAISTSRAYRRQLGYVPQEAFLFSGTVRDNIAYGRPDASDAEVERAARAVGAHDFIAGLPRRLPPPGDRARPVAVGGAAAAPLPGPRAPGRSGDPAARRGDGQPRPQHRGTGAAGDGRGRRATAPRC